jgi:hypothetical protein
LLLLKQQAKQANTFGFSTKILQVQILLPLIRTQKKVFIIEMKIYEITPFCLRQLPLVVSVSRREWKRHRQGEVGLFTAFVLYLFFAMDMTKCVPRGQLWTYMSIPSMPFPS